MCNVPLDAPMCPLQIINDIEPLNFIQYPSNVENYLTGHKSETNRPKKMDLWRIYYYTFILVLGSKFKIQMAKNLFDFF